MGQADARDENTRAERLGRMIKLYRTAWDMSRKDLAERAGLSYSYLSEIESGAKYPSSKALHLIAVALDCSPGDLMKAAEQSPDPSERVQLRAFREQPETLSELQTRIAKLARDERTIGARERQRAWFESKPRSLATDRPDTEQAQLEALMAELERLIAELEPGDRERVLDLARRLAAA